MIIQRLHDRFGRLVGRAPPSRIDILASESNIKSKNIGRV